MSRWRTEIDELFQRAEQDVEEQRRSCPDCGTPVPSADGRTGAAQVGSR